MKLSSACGLLLAALFALTNACGGDDDDDASANNGSGGSGTNGSGTNGSGTGGSGTGPAANCAGRCSVKATACMLPAELVDPYCQQLCGPSPTEGQLTCLEGKSCQELMDAVEPLSLCPAGTPGTGGSGTGGSGTGGSGTGGSGTGGSGTGDRAELGEVCDCSGAITCLDTEKGPCVGDLTCLDFATDSTNPDLLGVCSQQCTPDGTDQADCPSGYNCTRQFFNDADFGTWCFRR
ncbi:MAG TPA: hypothetical protein VFS43_39240 [Polyangiaceae bacterium]|nr:hypothetical protein [Polyangiaceae bacterium]